MMIYEWTPLSVPSSKKKQVFLLKKIIRGHLRYNLSLNSDFLLS